MAENIRVNGVIVGNTNTNRYCNKLTSARNFYTIGTGYEL